MATVVREAAPHPLDWDAEWQRASINGGARPISRNIMRTVFAEPGSGTADLIRLDDDAMVNVLNCVLPQPVRWPYEAEEPIIMLRASLACDVSFRYGRSAPIVFNRPEVLLACLPQGVTLTADVMGGSRQQGLVANFRAATFAKRFGLMEGELPPAVREVVHSATDVVRLSSFPVNQRIAALIADTLDSRLPGELRTMQVTGRLTELIAFALQAMQADGDDAATHRNVLLPRKRDLDVARAARERLDREYRRPPMFGEVASELGVSLNKLKSVFKEAFGTTMVDHCLDRRMREAQQLLLEGALTIAQVADRVGYEHQSSFTAAFRRHVGLAPREYRRHRAPFIVELAPKR
ncbi:helix-turn-helix transcriptional regulator [Pelomonas sp. KK5]|uniref:helix-turn-helix transcriptional regulator n=1 Tax=Pelomonas sp. KK5 TaxID=1855730 RepID=UPI00097C29CD|nr:AraC family transcriptional regulator [Pelomonas sp. KK5]